jgi:hypothetical protein
MAGVPQDFSPERLHEVYPASTSANPDSIPHPQARLQDTENEEDAVDMDVDVNADDTDDTDDVDQEVSPEDDMDTNGGEFNKGDTVMYKGKEYAVVVTADDANFVGVAPKGQEQEVDAIELVSGDQLSKAEGAASDMDDDAGDDEIDFDVDVSANGDDEMEDDMDSAPRIKESMHYHNDDNYETHVNHETQPTNVTAPYDTVFDDEKDEEEEDYEMAYDGEKVTVPSKVLSDLKSVIDDCKAEAEKAKRRDQDARMHYYADTAEALQIVHDHMAEKTIEGLKRAQLYAHRMANVSRHLMPDHVWKFIVDGGQKRSLKDYMNDVKKMNYPITGPRNTLDGNE